MYFKEIYIIKEPPFHYNLDMTRFVIVIRYSHFDVGNRLRNSSRGNVGFVCHHRFVVRMYRLENGRPLALLMVCDRLEWDRLECDRLESGID